MRTHRNTLTVLAADLGPDRAATLLSDALSGSDAAILRLERLAGVRAFRGFNDRDFMSVSKNIDGQSHWYGNRLTVPGAIPQSLATGVVGLKLGSVVSGSGVDDATIIEALPHVPANPVGGERASTTFQIEDEGTIGADEIPLKPLARRTRRLRMIAARSHLLWHGHHEDRFDIAIHDSIPEVFALIIMFGLLLVIFPFAITALLIHETVSGSRAKRTSQRKANEEMHLALAAA